MTATRCNAQSRDHAKADKAAKTRSSSQLLSAALAISTVVALGGCGVWFGESEVILPGERVALREASAEEAQRTNASARIPSPAGASSDWPQFGGSATRSIAHSPSTIALRKVWSSSIGAGSDSESRIIAPPVAANGRVYTLDAAATVQATSAADGREIWESELTPEDEDGRDGFGGGLAAAGDLLIATSGFGEILGLSTADGSIKWRTNVGAPIRSAPAVARGLIVATTRDGAVIAVDLATGAERWRIDGYSGGASFLGGGGSSPAVSGEVVVAPYPSGDIGILRLRDGRRGWTEPLGAGRRSSAISLIADISSSPVMSGGLIYAGGVSGQLAAFDIPTGRRVWARDIGAYNPVWAAEQTIFVVSEDARLMALAAGNGVTVWETALPVYEDPEDREGVIAYGGPVLSGGSLFLTSSQGVLYKINAVTGAIESEVDSVGESSISPIVAGGKLFVLDDGGTLSAFQ